MNRRELLQFGAAAPLAAPAALAQISTAPDWKPQLFDAHTNETVVALTELIIPATDTPGAKAALVNRWMDRLLAEGPAPAREEFLDGIHFLDGLAISRHGAPFVRLPEDRQTALLTELEAAGDTPGGRFFRLAKAWTSRVYYATEIGMEELNKGGRVPASFGCAHQHG